jgi:hypothetical protein
VPELLPTWRLWFFVRSYNNEFSRNQGNDEFQFGTAAQPWISAEMTGWGYALFICLSRQIAAVATKV